MVELIKNYIKLARPKHYIKNLLIFLPLIFSGNLSHGDYFSKVLLAFIVFSFMASSIYVINDLKDKNLDKLHSKKKNRPIASGVVSPFSATMMASLLLLSAFLISILANFSIGTIALLFLYFIINIAYSLGLKHIPVFDVLILALGFVLRVFVGGVVVNIGVSKWLYLTILVFALYLALGKRRNEIRANGSKTRMVNKYYNEQFLDKNMYVCLGLTIVYYSLWTIDPLQEGHSFFWSVPAFIVLVMLYSLAIESKDSDGDPVSVLLENKLLLAVAVLYSILMIVLVQF